MPIINILIYISEVYLIAWVSTATGTTLLIGQIQVFYRDSHEQGCYLGGDGCNLSTTE